MKISRQTTATFVKETWRTPADGHKRIDLALVREPCQIAAGDLGVVPPHLARQIKEQTAKDVADQMREQARQQPPSLAGSRAPGVDSPAHAVRTLPSTPS